MLITFDYSYFIHRYSRENMQKITKEFVNDLTNESFNNFAIYPHNIEIVYNFYYDQRRM